MAIENAKILNVRIKNKYDSYENWVASGLVLEAGEIAIAHTTVDVKVNNGTVKHPALLMKVGDGEKTFANLPWMSAKAADVLSVCKDEDELKTFINGVIADAGIASSDAMEALAGRVTTAEGEIDTLQADLNAENTGLKARVTTAEGAIDALEALVGDTKVADQITAAINALNLADTYAAKVHGHVIADVEGLETAIATAKKAGTDANAALEAYKTTNDAAVKVNSDAIAAIKNGETLDNFKEVEEALAGKQAAGDYATKTEAQGYANAKDTAIQAAQTAADNAQAAAEAAQADADALEALVGDTKVSEQISGAISDLDLANTYAAKSHTHTKSEITDFAHSHEMTEVNGLVDALAGKQAVGDYATKAEAQGYANAKDEAIAAAKSAADQAQEEVDVLETYVGTIPEGYTETNVVAYINKKAEETLNAASGGSSESAASVLAALNTYKTENDPKVQANTEAIAELEELVGDTKVSDAIATAVAAEKERAEGIEGGLETRLAAVEGDYLKKADKDELAEDIATNAAAIERLTNGVSAEEVDGVNDLIAYVNEHGTEVTGMKADIKTNADDIDALEGRMDAAEGAIALKAAQADLETLAGRVTTVEGDLNTETTGLKARMTAAEADIDALQGKVGDKAVSEQITDVTNPLTERVEALEAVDHEHANKDVLDGISADDVAAWDKVSEKANDADLAAIAKTGSTDDLVQGEMVLVFDCGTSAV